MTTGKTVLTIGGYLVLLLSTAAWADTVSPAVPQNLRVAATPPPPVEPWFEDSFEGEVGQGWSNKWFTNPWALHDTTDLLTPPLYGGSKFYRQFYPLTPAHLEVTLDHTTATFTSKGHGLSDGTAVSFSVYDDYPKNRVVAHTREFLPEGTNRGGRFPSGDGHSFNSSAVYLIANATADTFQIARYSLSNILQFTDNGVEPFYLHKYLPLGGLSLREWGSANSPIPAIGEKEEHKDLSFSYWLKYRRGYDLGGPVGNKHSRINTYGSPGIFVESASRGTPPTHFVSFTFTPSQSLQANIGGPCYVVTGEWVKFDFFVKVSTAQDGMLLGWVNNQLRWNYQGIQTLHVDGGNLSMFSFWAQVSSDLNPLGEGQERFLDRFRIGPGAMVLREQEDHGAL